MNEKFDISLYNDEFFAWHEKYAHQYSVATMNWYIDTFHPKSVADFGCGIGSYLLAAHQKGITQLKGYDIGGEFAKKYTPEEIREYITYCDLTKEMDQAATKEKYQLVMSFETAEHIEPEGTDTFLMNMLRHTHSYMSTILFTAAPPGQDGCGHINCQPRAFWLRRFRDYGWVEDQGTTKFVADNWKRLGAPDYIVNNLIILQ